MAKDNKLKGPIDGGQLEQVAALVRAFIPQHVVYAEPWFREGEIFFPKIPSRREVLNDPDERIVNFYVTVKTRWQELLFLIESTLYSSTLAELADDIYHGRKHIGSLYRAWALWLKYNRDRVNRNAWLTDTALWLSGYKEESRLGKNVEKMVSKRLEDVVLVNTDAVDFIRQQDTSETFFYFKPSDRKEAAKLAELLPCLKGLFIFYYPDKRVAERIAAQCRLNREQDAEGNVVYMNFKRQETLFDKID